MSRISRRTALGIAASGGAALVTSCHAAAPAPPLLSPAHGEAPMPSPRALSGTHTVLPLPFKPASLNGLSERLMVSHHEKNYGGAVKNLNRVEQELMHVNTDTPPFVTAALRDREL